MPRTLLNSAKDTSTMLLSLVQSLRKKGIHLGATNQLFAKLSSDSNTLPFDSFPVVEWKTCLQDLLSEAVLIKLSESKVKQIFIRLGCNMQDANANGRFNTQHWWTFIRQLQDNVSDKQKYAVVLSLDRATHYSQEFLDRIIELREGLYPVGLSIEHEHRSWNTLSALRAIRHSRINIVLHDAPSLAGFDYKLPNCDSRYACLRILGRNRMSWFSKDDSQKYSYDYNREELTAIAHSIAKLKEEHDNVYVIVAHHPFNTALSNLFELAHIISKL
jgi:hypothetical protein